ncbi:galactoside 2-alpha-L-fucosyltransferase-like [Ananas comosus]|uniref:Fucosyltransferase n=1 Tax=Ananas comosus TaxID=4615 RepID=A0A6P5GXC5_ANACO|nr:galactoside 2-alpha-L-fucosyltransferase-like [Ananas comosus]
MRSQKPSAVPQSAFGAVWPSVVLIGCLMTLPLLVFLCSGGQWNSSTVWLQRVSMAVHQGFVDKTAHRGSEDAALSLPRDSRLGGLIAPGFDEQSCISRYQSCHFRKPTPHSPSSYLLSRLRKYEALHKRCGPNTALYRKSITQLNSGHSMNLMECNYVVWAPFNGLGNRMLTIASAFLYALVTNRVLLIHQTEDLTDLFCEPFPGTSWVLPSDFPVKDLSSLRLGTEQSYGNLLKNKKIKQDAKVMSESLPPYVYVHLQHDYEHTDRLFFCDEDQLVLKKINWLLLTSDMYFVPSMFLIPQFEEELRWMFPEKETVFHHVGRYLFHPTNAVWGMVARYYTSYLAMAEEKVGIQIRTFSWLPISSENFFNQIIACSRQENLLPGINLNATFAASRRDKAKSKAILVTSLYSEYYERIKSMYFEHTTATGEIISVYQPTHEEQQKTDKQSHNQKALAEMYLLSYCDVLITSGWSTFGYISQGLAGLKPWILLSPKDQKAPDPPCVRAMSMEPCFHAPPSYDCKAKKNVDMGAIVRHVRHCEDVGQGIKLFD